MSHARRFLDETAEIASLIDASQVEEMAKQLVALRQREGRLFIIGLGGSAANASHAVNDFRKLCGIDAYTPTDNVAELTARANDEGWQHIFRDWLIGAKINHMDAIFVLSVGGGKDNVSRPIYEAIDAALEAMAWIFGIVGRDGGHTKQYGHHVLVIPTIAVSRVTPHSEAFQSVILHCLVSHPDLQIRRTIW